MIALSVVGMACAFLPWVTFAGHLVWWMKNWHIVGLFAAAIVTSLLRRRARNFNRVERCIVIVCFSIAMLIAVRLGWVIVRESLGFADANAGLAWFGVGPAPFAVAAVSACAIYSASGKLKR